MTPDPFTRIATKLNRELQIRAGAITAEQVASVAKGTERTLNHPVIAAIRTELKRKKMLCLTSD